MNHNFDFQGCQKMHIRVAISQKGLIGLFANCCHLMLLGPKEWKHKSKVLRTHFKNFFIPGTLWGGRERGERAHAKCSQGYPNFQEWPFNILTSNMDQKPTLSLENVWILIRSHN